MVGDPVPTAEQRRPMKLLITDLDDTLYDWVSFYAVSFTAMLKTLSSLLQVDEEQLIAEFREVHRGYGYSEPPFAVLELPSVRARYGNLDRRSIAKVLDPALHAFNSKRKRLLALFPTVRETLNQLTSRFGVTLIGHTEASLQNAYFRLLSLDIANYFQRLYVIDKRWPGHPKPERDRALSPKEGFVRVLPASERKPNPHLLRRICAAEGFSRHETWYVGDSLLRDVAMARAAGVHSAWAKYGTEYDPQHWETLVAISHWTVEDVAREDRLKRDAANAEPEVVLSTFADLLAVVGNSGESTARKPEIGVRA